VNKSFSDELKHQTIDNWNRILSHNFIVEMAKDILPISKFVFYLKQDQIFLESLSKLLATASRIAYDRQTKTWFESLLDSTTRYEMPMQLEIINLLEDDLKSSGVSQEKTTQNYVSHLERVSNSDDLAMMLSAMAPCPWTYYEISQALIEKILSLRFSKNG
jgi:thiaminase (transcriptional activator TenA)